MIRYSVLNIPIAAFIQIVVEVPKLRRIIEVYEGIESSLKLVPGPNICCTYVLYLRIAS